MSLQDKNVVVTGGSQLGVTQRSIVILKDVQEVSQRRNPRGLGGGIAGQRQITEADGRHPYA
ncbi:hypothetical protein [Bosea sp. Tri-44]|uniref:hypothetical protein n=1 Tax=Bosea sp. Tri-44 TaxID=1972137 RepID=UPI0013E95D99|nr:hypothetical protein [Bosea sp. Tri-44]